MQGFWRKVGESHSRSQRRAGERQYFRVDTSCFPYGLFTIKKPWTWDLRVRRLCHICCSNDPVDIHSDSKNTHKHIHTWKHFLTAHLFSVWPRFMQNEYFCSFLARYHLTLICLHFFCCCFVELLKNTNGGTRIWTYKHEPFKLHYTTITQLPTKLGQACAGFL